MKVEFKMTKKEIEMEYPGEVNDGNFVDASVNVAIEKIAEQLTGWQYYDVDNIERINNNYTRYDMSLHNEKWEVVGTAEVEVYEGTVEVTAEIEK